MDVVRPTYGFEQLEVYKDARELRRKLYALAKRLPAEEKFNLISQVRRARLSVTNNIAEGHGRYYYAENAHFLLQARGSLQEIIDDLNLCSDEKYLREEELKDVKDDCYMLLRRLNGYISHLRKSKQRESDRDVAAHNR